MGHLTSHRPASATLIVRDLLLMRHQPRHQLVDTLLDGLVLLRGRELRVVLVTAVTRLLG
eukprot:1127508-Pyramimonas_sp.AAC.1